MSNVPSTNADENIPNQTDEIIEEQQTELEKLNHQNSLQTASTTETNQNSPVTETAKDKTPETDTQREQSDQEPPKRTIRKAQRTRRVQIQPPKTSETKDCVEQPSYTKDSDVTIVKQVETVTASDTSNMTSESKGDNNKLDQNNVVVDDEYAEEDKLMEEFLVKQSPQIVKALSKVVHGFWVGIKMVWDFICSIGTRTRKYIPLVLGICLYGLMAYLLEFQMIPFTYDDLPHYPARLQYISRMFLLSLFPIIVSWFTGHSAPVVRLVQAYMRDLLLLFVSLCSLATFLPVQEMHWMFVFVVVSTLFRLVHWLAVCYDLKKLQSAVEGPIQLSVICITLYTFLSVVAQETGFMPTASITKPHIHPDGDVQQWSYPNMCNVVQRLFCGASKTDTI